MDPGPSASRDSFGGTIMTNATVTMDLLELNAVLQALEMTIDRLKRDVETGDLEQYLSECPFGHTLHDAPAHVGKWIAYLERVQSILENPTYGDGK